MDRRHVIAALSAMGGLGVFRRALAQPRKNSLRLALLDESSGKWRWPAFFKRLAELGYVEGKNLVVDRRYAEGKIERLGPLAAQLVALHPDIICVQSTPEAQAAMRASASIPVVFMGIGDPVGAGLVAALARPGGNVTGITSSYADFGAKWMELLREIAPAAKHLAYLSDARNKGSQLVFAGLQEHADRMRVTIQFLDGGAPADLTRSLGTLVRERLEGFIVGAPNRVLDQREEIVAFAARHKVPAIYSRREYPDIGGLLSYGPDSGLNSLLGADYVRRIAEGTKPADLPVQQQNKVLTVVNQRTARALGVAIPRSVLTRADEVIE